MKNNLEQSIFYKNTLGIVYKGDCLDILSYFNNKFNLILTVPPYGSTACNWDNIINFNKMW